MLSFKTSKRLILQLKRLSIMFLLPIAVFSAPLKIMPLGDSRTAGPTSRDCYRLYLDRMLTSAGASFDFVGTQIHQSENTRPADSIFDLNHQGMWGFITSYLISNPSYGWEKENVGNWTRLSKPDIVLALLGTPDLFQSDIGKKENFLRTQKNIESIIDTLRVVNPSVIIILGNLYPVSDSLQSTNIDTFNLAIPTIVAKKNTIKSPVVFVDTWTGFDRKSDLVDWMHANQKGSIKIATQWYNALTPYLPVSIRKNNSAYTLQPPTKDFSLFSHSRFDKTVFGLNGRALQSSGKKGSMFGIMPTQTGTTKIEILH